LNHHPDFEQLKERLSQDPNILFALIFGSHAKPRRRPPRDLDIAIFFRDPPYGLEVLDLIHELSEFTKQEVDLVVLNRASAFLRHQVMKHAIRLFIRDRVAYRQFREKTMTDYDIYKYVSGMNKYDRPTFS
jgi:predicted nucleotidyltransferase